MEQNGLIHGEAPAGEARLKRIVVSKKAMQYKDIVIEDITNLEK